MFLIQLIILYLQCGDDVSEDAILNSFIFSGLEYSKITKDSIGLSKCCDALKAAISAKVFILPFN